MPQFSVGDNVRSKASGIELVVDCWNLSLGQYVCSFANTKKDGKKTTYYSEAALEKTINPPRTATEDPDLLRRVRLLEERVRILEERRQVTTPALIQNS